LHQTIPYCKFGSCGFRFIRGKPPSSERGTIHMQNSATKHHMTEATPENSRAALAPPSPQAKRRQSGWRASLVLRLATQELPGHKPVVPGRPTILVVSHASSRTGAPIVAQNLVSLFAQHYNVVVLCLAGGVLIDSFRQDAIAVHFPRATMQGAHWATGAIDGLAGKYDFRFAIVNSACSRSVGSPLESKRVPYVALVHEFASHLNSPVYVRRFFDAASLLVFSSSLTRDHAERQIGFSPDASVHTIPQGKCVVPGATGTENRLAEDSIRTDIRPPGSEHDFVVLGAGSITYRKGVDLFLAILEAARTKAPDVPWRFVWIGDDKDDASVGQYSLFVADQIERSGLSEAITILPPTPAIEAAYDAADVLLLSSRLDPLPNVAIDAMAQGLPVVCFDQTTGIADLLRDVDVAGDCVAPYLDIGAMADRLIALATSPQRHEEIGRRVAALVDERLQMDRYADSLRDLIEAKLAARA
jgi:glycosyltransferase involved in cell wall biosynthesis